MSVSMGNAVRSLKCQISSLGVDISDDEVRRIPRKAKKVPS
jgi:hypothetical protein